MKSMVKEQVFSDLESVNPVQSLLESRESELRTDAERAMRRHLKESPNENPFAAAQTDFDPLLVLLKDSLGKLADVDCREVGAQEVQSLIREYNSPDALRTYLQLIHNGVTELNEQTKNSYVLLLNYIAKAYKSKLLDPIDNLPSLLKSVGRVCELARKYLRVSIGYKENRRVRDKCSIHVLWL